MPKDSDATLAALIAGPNDPPPPTTWVVMQFGASQRPAIACSTDLSLAIAHFLELTHMVMALAPEGDYRMAADDTDMTLQGLSLYHGDLLALALQPAGGLVRHPAHPALPSLPTASFETSAPLLLAALAKRSTLTEAQRDRFARSSVAFSWARDVDEAIREAALTEHDVKGKFTAAQIAAVWNSVRSARTMMCLTGPLG